MRRTDRPILEQIIRDVLEQNPNALNAEIAAEASTQLGISVSNQRISRIRNEIGLGVFDLYGLPPSVHEELRVITRFLAHHAVRNTILEDYHAGMSPSSRTGDYSDVHVVSPFGEIGWLELSRISDQEMRTLMLDVEKHLLQTLLYIELLKKRGEYQMFLEAIHKYFFGPSGISWDNPQLG